MVDFARPLFALGEVVGTPAAMKALEESEQDPIQFVRRHETGDWGEVDAEDARANEIAVDEGLRILSAYTTAKGVRIWIITEADRSETTVLLPEEY